MIIGRGQLAEVFFEHRNRDDVVIFASGVSNSNCVSNVQFEREYNLLLSTLKIHYDKKFVYFSSCALSASNYTRNEYYNHKKKMEELIQNHSKNYYIFRIPQLFGKLKHHKTIINFLYESILNDEKFVVYDNAYRYVIEIHDVKKIVETYLEFSKPSIVVDIANPYRYTVLGIVNILEKLLGKNANYDLVHKEDKYLLDLSAVKNFIIDNNLEVTFGEDYLKNKLEEKIQLTL